MVENEIPKDNIRPGNEVLEREKFFESIRQRMMSVARKRIQGDEAQDIVQEAIMILNSKLSQLQSDNDVLPYAFQILRNCIGNYYKRVKREQRVIEFSVQAESAAVALEETSDWQDVLSKALAHLRKENPRCAQLFDAVLESAGIAELEKMFDLTADNVYRTLYRCRGRLKKILTEEMRIQLP